MGHKVLYQLSGKQIGALALASAVLAACIVMVVVNLGVITNGFQDPRPTNVRFDKISNPSTVSDEKNSIEVYKAVSPGVAFITTSALSRTFYGEIFERKSGNGSGSVIDEQGHILTNYHVIEKASKLTVSFGGDRVFRAKLVGGDPDTDLAVIKITPPREGLTVVPLGDSDQLDVGQKVLAIGNPFGLDRTLTTGVISGLQRPIRARNKRPIDAAIQTDASINPGNSGGPLLDKYGRMIGINSQILSPAGGSVGVGFAVPANTAKRVVPQLIKYGEVRRPKMGITARGIEELGRGGSGFPVSKGLLVLRAVSGGSAERAGIQGVTMDQDSYILGDIILAIDGKDIGNIDDLYRFLETKKIGDTVRVKVYRDGDTRTIPVRLLPPPVSNRRR